MVLTTYKPHTKSYSVTIVTNSFVELWLAFPNMSGVLSVVEDKKAPFESDEDKIYLEPKPQVTDISTNRLLTNGRALTTSLLSSNKEKCNVELDAGGRLDSLGIISDKTLILTPAAEKTLLGHAECNENDVATANNLDNSQVTNHTKNPIEFELKDERNELVHYDWENLVMRSKPKIIFMESPTFVENVKKSSNFETLRSVAGLEKSSKSKDGHPDDDLPQRDDELLTASSPLYDDIASILNVLESAESHQMMRLTTKCAIPSTSQSETEANKDSSISNNQCVEREIEATYGGPQLSSNYNSSCRKLSSFLDEIDRSCWQPLEELKTGIKRTDSENNKPETSLEKLLTYSRRDLSQQVINLGIKLKHKSSSIALLQAELTSLRTELLSLNRTADDTLRTKLKTQRDEFEGTIKRHQKFIDQLISDKKSLNKQYEDLVAEMETLQRKYESNLKTLEHKHRVELQRLKEIQMADERIKRERWIEFKKQKIKDLTVKSLEPELQNMEKRQQQDLADLRSLHKREIEEIELKAARRTQEECEAIRIGLVEEREKLLARECEVIKRRHETMIESEEKGYRELRRKLLAEHAARIAECEEKENFVLIEKDKAIKQAQRNFEERLQIVLARHANEIRIIKESSKVEMDLWQNNYSKQQVMRLAEKEATIREECARRRDKEIESVIERLEKEADETKSRIERCAEKRIERFREKYEKDIQDLEDAERETKAKYMEMRTQMSESEDVINDHKKTTKQLQMQLIQATTFAAQLKDDRQEFERNIRAQVHAEMETLRNELSTRNTQIEELHARVRVSIARRDEILDDLKKDYKSMQDKCMFLESMLNRQRKQ